MLDNFLKVAFATQTREAEQASLVEKMRLLPDEYLLKIATGEEKLAYGMAECGPAGNGSWLDKFKGTPMFEQAIELEKQDLQEQMAEQARWREEDASRSQRNAARDELSIQRKLLELQLASAEAGGSEAQPFAGEETPEEEALEHGAGSPEALAAAQQPQQAAPQPQPQAPQPEAPAEKAASARLIAAVAKMKVAEMPQVALEQSASPPLTNPFVNQTDEGKERAETMGRRGMMAGAMLGAAPTAIKAMRGQPTSALNAILPTLQGAAITGVGAGIGSWQEGAGNGAIAGGLASAIPGALYAASGAPMGSGWRGTLGRAAVGAGMGGLMGAGAGALAAKKKPEPQAEEHQLAQEDIKTAERFEKVAIGLGLLGKAVAGGAKNVAKGATGAFQTSRAFGGTMGEAGQMAMGSLKSQVPTAMGQVGRAAKGYMRANPGQAAALAGGAGLAGGLALGQ